MKKGANGKNLDNIILPKQEEFKIFVLFQSVMLKISELHTFALLPWLYKKDLELSSNEFMVAGLHL